jgi:hypothetical protein
VLVSVFRSWSLLFGVLVCAFWAWIGVVQEQPLAFVFGGVPLAAVLLVRLLMLAYRRPGPAPEQRSARRRV